LPTFLSGYLIPFASTYLSETGFSALMALHTHTQHHSRLNVESDLQCIVSPTAPRIYNIVTNSIVSTLIKILLNVLLWKQGWLHATMEQKFALRAQNIYRYAFFEGRMNCTIFIKEEGANIFSVSDMKCQTDSQESQISSPLCLSTGA
ncbi:hypothetical protein T12_8924, partial [Trichinella patagoniensis]